MDLQTAGVGLLLPAFIVKSVAAEVAGGNVLADGLYKSLRLIGGQALVIPLPENMLRRIRIDTRDGIAQFGRQDPSSLHAAHQVGILDGIAAVKLLQRIHSRTGPIHFLQQIVNRIAALHLHSTLQGIDQAQIAVLIIQPLTIGIDADIRIVIPVDQSILLCQNGPVDLPHTLNVLRFGQGDIDGGRGIHPHLHRLYGIHGRHTALHAQQIKVHDDADDGHGDGHQRKPFPAALEDSQALCQQHGGQIVTDGTGNRHAHQQRQQIVILTTLIHAPEHIVQQQTTGQRTAEGHAIAEDGLHPANCHHFTGRLAAAALIQEPCSRSQRHAHQRIDGNDPAVFQLHTHQLTGVFLNTLVNSCRDLLIDVPLPDLLHQKHGGTEEIHRAGELALISEEKALCKDGDQHIQQHRQEVEDEIQHRQRHDVGSHESHCRGAGEVEEALPRDGQNGHQNAHKVNVPGQNRQKDAQRTGHGIGDGDHGHAGEEVGDKQTLSADGQRMQKSYAAGVVEIVPHAHGAEDGIKQRDQGHTIGHHGIVDLGHFQTQHIIQEMIVLQNLHQKRQRENGTEEGGHTPQRPEPGQVFAKQRGIKVRCL